MKKWGGIIIGILIFFLILAQVFLAGLRYEKFVFKRVVDGDTFWVTNLRDGSEWKVRLWGVNAPDQGECYFDKATMELEKMLVGKKINFEKMGRDNYGRILAKVYVDGVGVEEMLVAAGAAIAYDAKDIHDELRPSKEYVDELKKIEEKARKEKRGIWSVKCL